jgi:lipopolysaccharide transport system ATP-binding protein
MSSPAAISIEGLGKCYRIGLQQRRPARLGQAVRQTLLAPFQYLRTRLREASEAETLWALRDISFEVRPGEVLGVIGRNGAGKSTLLRILSRITDPSVGRAVVRGRLNALLEVGTGFHPELTGRENIFMNAALHGMRQADVRRSFDEIVEFAEIARFIDTPVKRYSSGMYMRLAFAVAAHLEPDILVVDEVLAVGDFEFQKKCLGKMQDVAGSGRTILFVSHNMEAVQRLCHRCVLLEGGRVRMIGDTRPVVEAYFGPGQTARHEKVWPEAERPGDDIVRLSAVRCRNAAGQSCGQFTVGEAVHLELEYEVRGAGACLDRTFFLYHESGALAFVTRPDYAMDRGAGCYRETCVIPADFLNAGVFSVLAGITSPPWTPHAVEHDVVGFRVVDDFGGRARRGYTREWPGGILRPALEWQLERAG